MSVRETQNFMSVAIDSFSDLPFVQPIPARDSSSNSCPSIRLFGIEFPHEPDSPLEETSKDPHTSTTDTIITPNCTTNTSIPKNNCGNGLEIQRKFECHYCRRNFPTSQALGGHQNAHKRERQDAKRAHLPSVIASHHHHHPGLITNGHIYGLLGYHRLGSVSSARRFEIPPLPTYPSWNSTGASMSPRARFYGRPSPGLWKVPVHGGTAGSGMIHRDYPMTLPLFGVDDSRMVGIGEGGSVGSYSSSSSSWTSPQDQDGYGSGEKSVSLDLHL